MNATNTDIEHLKDLAFKYGFGLDDAGHDTQDLGTFCDNLSRNAPVSAPIKSRFYSYAAYHGGKVLGANLTKADMEKLHGKHPGLVSEQIFDQAGYNKAKKEHINFRSDLNDLFKGGLFYLTHTLDHPKAVKAYSMAYDMKHSDGYHAVANLFDDLVELIK